MSSDKPANENQISNEEMQEWMKKHFKEPEPGKNPDGTDKGEKKDE